MRRGLLSFAVVLSLSLPLIAVAQTTTTPLFQSTKNNFSALEDTVLGPGAAHPYPQEVAGQLTAVVLGAVGVVFFILIIYGGYLWGTARGNADKVEQGKKLIFEASIGTIIIFLAYFIAIFVIQQIGNATLGGPLIQ